MVDEASLFGLSMLGTVVGLVLMLYGVLQNAGQSFNTLMMLGGAVVVVSILVHTGTLASLDRGHGPA